MSTRDPNTLTRRLRALMMRFAPLMITCQELENFIDNYLDDELDARQRRYLEIHLRLCRDCRSYVEAYKRAIALSRAVLRESEEDASGELPDDLAQAILAARTKEPD